MTRLWTADDLRNGASVEVVRMLRDSGCPEWEVADHAPDTDADMIRHWQETGRIKVWAGASEGVVYGEARHNWMYRAWHDWCHIASGVCNRRHGPLGCFEPSAERDVTAWQVRTVGSSLFQRVVLADTGGQAIHFGMHGAFPEDQMRFTLDIVNGTGEHEVRQELAGLRRFR